MSSVLAGIDHLHNGDRFKYSFMCILISLCYFTLSNTRRFYSSRDSLWSPGGKGLTGPICPSLFLNSFFPRPAKASPFVILLCLMPDNFICQGRASVWERVKLRSKRFKPEHHQTNVLF